MMKLISITNIKGKKGYLCEFFCPQCTKIILKRKDQGLRDKTCGHSCKGKVCYKRGLINIMLVGMKQRCYNKNHQGYHRYGGRGIKICDTWKNNFGIFKKWCLSNGYKKGLQIDRINNDGNYEPSNCRFVTAKENMRNRSTTKFKNNEIIEIKRLIIANVKYDEICKKFKVSISAIFNIKSLRSWGDVGHQYNEDLIKLGDKRCR